MANAAIFILTGNESHADYGRLANGLEAAKEFAETDGDEVTVVFDGAGTQWIPELIDTESDYHDLYTAIRDEAIVCDYCAGAFGVEDAVDEAGLTLVNEYEGHPSVREFVADGYEVITF
ncbi:DsrE family protein [Halohasta litorea]|uniref:DsrE family protein n=1 Tax=Halohasta litorea TaxID=869891 RepID=A0ABD6D7X7_9EURY|nr:DsrE family protein [Halohasta litorea]